MRLYEYKCSDGHVTEERREMERRNDPLICHCGKIADRKLSIVNNFFGWTYNERYMNTGQGPKGFRRNVS